MWDSLRSSANSKHAGLKVDVGPLEPKRLALTKAKGQRDRVQSSRRSPLAALSRMRALAGVSTDTSRRVTRGVETIAAAL
jgi:hypothetical protein